LWTAISSGQATKEEIEADNQENRDLAAVQHREFVLNALGCIIALLGALIIIVIFYRSK